MPGWMDFLRRMLGVGWWSGSAAPAGTATTSDDYPKVYDYVNVIYTHTDEIDSP